MKCNRVNLKLTSSAALAGLLLSLAPSAAHGHGNNPKNTSDTAPDTSGGPGDPPEVQPGPTAGAGEGQTAGSQIFDGLGPSVIDGLTPSPDVTVFVGADATLSDVLDVPLQVLIDPATIGMDFLTADTVEPRIIIDVFGTVDGSGSSGVQAPSVIPAPGTLALLGLAAAAAARRRRRRERT